MKRSFRLKLLPATIVATCAGLTYTGSTMAEESVQAESAALAYAGIDNITIIGKQQDALGIAGSAHVLSTEDLERFEYTDVNQILRQVPGINIREEEGLGLRPNIGIRGTGSERSARITLMEDGVLIAPAPYSASSAYYFPTAGRLSGIEVLKGSAAIKNGPQTVGGAVNLLSTPIPEDEAGRITLEAGEDGALRGHAYYGDSKEHFGWLVETHQQRSDGFKDIDNTSRDTGFDKEDYLVKLRLNTDEDADIYHQVDIKFQYADETSNQSYLGLTDVDFGRDAERQYTASQLDEFNSDHEQVVLSYLVDFNNGVRLSATAYNNEFERNWFKTEGLDVDGSVDAQAFSRRSWQSVINAVNAGAADASALQAILDGGDSAPGSIQVRANAREYYSRGIQFKADITAETGDAEHKIEVGLRYHEDEEDRLQRNSTYHQEGGRLVLDDFGLLGNAGNRVQEAEALAFFVSDTISIGDWVFSPGVRIEDIELGRKDYGRQPLRDAANLRERDNDVRVVLPGVGVRYDLTAETSLIFGVHEGFTPPGNSPDTDEEESVNYEAGVRHNEGAFSGELIGFFSDYENLLGTCTASTGSDCVIGDQFNGNGVEVKGIEATASYTFGSESGLLFPVALNYTYTDSEFQSSFDSDFFGDVTAGDPVTYTPENQGRLSVGVERTERWSAFLTANYIDEMCTEAACGRFNRTDDSLTFGLAGKFRLNEHAELYMNVDNLTDEEDIIARQPYGARGNKPRTVTLGVRLDI